MLYTVTATHHADNCPALEGVEQDGYTETLGRLGVKDWADQNGVTVFSLLVNGPAHKVFMILVGNELKNVHDYLRPIKGLGHCEVVPVSPLPISSA